MALAPPPLSTTGLRAPLATSPFAELSWRDLGRRGLRVLLVCLMVGLVLGYLRGQVSARHVVYSVCIGTLSWLSIDLGRFALRPDPHSGWPTGWRGPMLCTVGCSFGFVAGTALGDLLNGFEIYSGYRLGLRSLANDIVVSGLIGALLSGYYYVRGKDAYHQAKAAQAERDLALARLAMLQTQLEPHMLFNTLANLRVLIGLEPPRAQAMLDRLIAYLRATLGASQQPWHPLSAEFDRLADYLALMAVRMGPRLQVRIELPDALRQLPVPPMLLQPLVENAIQHGLEPSVAGGCITLRAEARGAVLALGVHDTGVGLAGPSAAIPLAADGHGYGTRHVRDRLATLYGDAASLRLTPAPAGGTLAEVLLPLTADPTLLTHPDDHRPAC